MGKLGGGGRVFVGGEDARRDPWEGVGLVDKLRADR
jgi:hypothetical protein